MQDFKVKEVEEVEGGKGRGHTDTHTHIYLIRKLNLGSLLTFHMSLGSEV